MTLQRIFSSAGKYMKQVDMLGFEVAADDYVCGNYAANEVGVFRVLRLTEKMLVLVHYKADTGFQKGKPREHRRYATELIKLNDEQLEGLAVRIDLHEKELLIKRLARK